MEPVRTPRVRPVRPGAADGTAGFAPGVPLLPRPGPLAPMRGGKTLRTSGRFSITTRYVRSFCGCSRVIDTLLSLPPGDDSALGQRFLQQLDAMVAAAHRIEVERAFARELRFAIRRRV